MLPALQFPYSIHNSEGTDASNIYRIQQFTSLK